MNNPQRQSLIKRLRFPLTFLATLIILSFLYAWLTAEFHSSLTWIKDGTAGICAGMLSIVSSDTYSANHFVTYCSFSLEIIDECTGLFEMVILVSAIVAFPTTVRNKLIGVAIGIPAIYLFNLIRLVVLLVIGAESKSLFNFMHLYLWQVILVLMVGTVWGGWLYSVVYREKRSIPVSK